MRELYASPVEAYKLARLVKIEGKVRFAPLNLRVQGTQYYENPGEAVCDEGYVHNVPNKTCTCGFYAVSGREDLWRLGWHTLETATLRVLLHGRIVEHKYGYRSQNQDVQTAEIAERCWWCGERAEILAKRKKKQKYLAPSCKGCAKIDRTTLEKASEDLGCSIVFGADIEDKASNKTERRVLMVQTIPAVLFAAGAISVAVATDAGGVAGVGGLIAGGWLVPGRLLAERVINKAGLGLREMHRVLARTAGWALFCAMGGWGAAAIVSVAHTNI